MQGLARLPLGMLPGFRAGGRRGLPVFRCGGESADRQPEALRKQSVNLRGPILLPDARYRSQQDGKIGEMVMLSTDDDARNSDRRSEEHTSELQSLMRISYAVFCLNKKNDNTNVTQHAPINYTKITVNTSCLISAPNT